MLGLSAGGNASTEGLLEWLDTNGITFPVALDDADTYRLYADEDAPAPYPIDVVADADGTIVYLAREYDPDALREAVEGVLQGR